VRNLDIRDAQLQSPSLSDSTDVAGHDGQTDINVLPQLMDVNVG